MGASIRIQDEDDELAEAAEGARRLTPRQRERLFRSLMRMVERAWSGLSHEERLRRLRIGEELEPRPSPWWREVRPDASREP